MSPQILQKQEESCDLQWIQDEPQEAQVGLLHNQIDKLMNFEVGVDSKSASPR